MNKNYKGKILGITLLIAVLVGGFAMYYINTHTAKTVTVYKETVENKIKSTGLICAPQTLIRAENDGIALYNCREGKLILPYAKIATVYTGEISDESREKLRAVNDKIVFAEANEKQGKNIVGDVTSINRDINNAVHEIITETNVNNFENVYKLKNEIIAYNKKLMELKGVKVEIKEENLNDEINKIEAGLTGGKKEYRSPVNGMFSTKITPWDELVTPESIMTLSVKDYKNLLKEDEVEAHSVKSGKPFCKIINNYEWYIVSSFPVSDIEDLEVDEWVEIRVTTNSDRKVDGIIKYISEASGKEACVVIKSTKHLDNIWTSGKVEFELIKNTKTGFKLPQSALIERDGKKGVYAVKDSLYKFIEVEPLIYDGDYVIIKDKTLDGESQRSCIILYDYVVINPEKVREGDFAS
ncbi:MAG: hypothetical protein E7411_04260 [Ruminococcaceae bacterium]|nr:hypothetical protein [Oscillospiraceae bacterium]